MIINRLGRVWLFFICASVYGQTPSLVITLDESYPQEVRPRLQAVAEEVAAIVARKFSQGPPQNLPIECYKTTLTPIAMLDNWQNPTRIRIGLTAEGSRHAQFVFQLGHELGHVMLGLYRSNGLLETFATAMSHEVLDELAARWKASAAISEQTYAPNFITYREGAEKKALQRFPAEIQTAIAQRRWDDVRLYLRMLAFDLDQLSNEAATHEEGRALQILAALVLRAKGIPWNRVHDLGGCTEPSPQQIRAFLYLPIEKRCVSAMADILAPIGIIGSSTDLVMATFDQKPQGNEFVFYRSDVKKWVRLSEIKKSEGAKLRKRLAADSATSVYVTIR